MTYKRVTPRDLFNEAKLLKCMGRLELHMLDWGIEGLKSYHDTEQSEGFEIEQNPADGSISISNLHYTNYAGAEVRFYTLMNAKDNYPFVCEFNGEEYYPFNEDGTYQLDKNLFAAQEA